MMGSHFFHINIGSGRVYDKRLQKHGENVREVLSERDHKTIYKK